MYEQISRNIWRSRLLLAFFVVLVAAFGLVFSAAFNAPIIAVLAVAIAVASAVGSYYHSDRIVLATSGARPADRLEFPHYVNSVEGLAIAAGIPCPRPYVIDDPAPNAFATGRDPDHAVVCVTTGLLEITDRVELEGVIGHEMAHIKNYDIRFMMLVAVLVGSIALMADWFWRGTRFARFRGRGRAFGQVQIAYWALGLVLAILAPVCCGLVKAAISRQREYLADSNGALLTRYPDGLASALEKIALNPRRLQAANKATAHLFIVNPMTEYGWFKENPFSTHPPIPERIRRLREM
mgnify:FL=1